MSVNEPAFRWSNARVAGPRRTSTLPYGPLSDDNRKKMGLVNGVCTSMGSMFCFTQCDQHPHEDCPVVEDSAVLAGVDTNCGTPCQSCTLRCPCKVQTATVSDTHFSHDVEADLAEQEARLFQHVEWWQKHCATARTQT